jgi:hypothetical protein
MSRMTYMRSWKGHRFTSNTWLGLNPQIGRPLSRIVVPLVIFSVYLLILQNIHSLGVLTWMGREFIKILENWQFGLSFNMIKCATQSKWDQTWNFLTLANRPNFSICLFYSIMYKNCILSFWNFHPSLFMALEVFKEKSKKINMITRKED